MRTHFAWMVTPFVLMAAVGCSEAKEVKSTETAVVAQATETPSAAPAAPAAAGHVTGKIMFSGTQPTLKKLDMAADPVCQGLHAGAVHSETVLVNANGTLKNVFVYVKKGLEGKTFPAASEKVKFDQHTCMYDPHVMGVRVGQPIEIVNSDTTLHNVHAMAKVNPEFNYGMPFEGMALPAQFDKPEIMVKVKCDVHPWMNAYIGVVEHPHFAVTGDDGSFDLGELAPGEYVIEAWHEYYAAQTQTITVPAAGEVVFTFAHTEGGA
ncbi:MAG: hypothetical protein HYY14_01020 [Candidatus Omnitrophica bacterium]|nr:hypothetical protein [Candidatus Omnitrophota bacterium]